MSLSHRSAVTLMVVASACLSQDDELGKKVEFILDSGSDASCLPPSLQWAVDRSKENPLHVSGTQAVLTFADQDQHCSGVISETFFFFVGCCFG